MGDRISVGGRFFKLMIPERELHQQINRVAGQLAERYRHSNPLMLCILNGAAIFHADLIRQMPIPLSVDYLRVSSYGDGMQSLGALTFTARPGTEIAGRNVIVVEDIVDTGRTSARLREYLLQQGAASVAVAALLFKPEAFGGQAPPEFIGIEIPDRFVVGFGLDFAQQGRNLPAIYALDEQDDTQGTDAPQPAPERSVPELHQSAENFS
ncbi:MAG: hypoxanthine phosphoribosyltransferase [Chlorobi bacterium CHB2]|nr:hypoxanthine phosphoribosyltransferase [Chlorobi bacterium CHB2]